jgi:hypothetical protein
VVVGYANCDIILKIYPWVVNDVYQENQYSGNPRHIETKEIVMISSGLEEYLFAGNLLLFVVALDYLFDFRDTFLESVLGIL